MWLVVWGLWASITDTRTPYVSGCMGVVDQYYRHWDTMGWLYGGLWANITDTRTPYMGGCMGVVDQYYRH